MNALTQAIGEYAEQHTTPMGAVLNGLYRETYLHRMNPRMMAGPVQGKFLQFLCQLMHPEKVLEIGTFTGFATICMARGMDENSLLTTIEANEEYEDTIRRYLEKAGVEDRVKLIIGDAKQVIPTLENGFDLVYIDADKRHSADYYDLVVDKVRPNGLILVDNVLWDGKVTDDQVHDTDTQAIRAFNDKVQNDSRVENVLLPMRDGLMMIQKLPLPVF